MNRRTSRLGAKAALCLALGSSTVLAALPAGAASRHPRGSSKQITVGVAAITEGSPNVLQQLAMIQTCAKVLGWKITVLNANGDPAQMAADMSALVNQNVNAIIDIAEQPSQTEQGMLAAKAKGIPIFAQAAPLIDPKHLTVATYAPSDARMSRMLAKQMIKDTHGKGKALDLVASAITAIVIRDQTLRAATKGTGITVAATHETDLANPIADTQAAVSDALKANPGINLVWALQDFEFSTTLQTVASQHLGKVGVFSYYLDPIDFSLLRADKNNAIPEAVADSPVYDTPWYAFDAMVNKFLLHKKNWVTSMNVHPLPYTLVTPNTVQAKGTVYHYASFKPFFVNRWKHEGVSIKA